MYGSSYASLGQVTVDLPIDPKLRGGALWYDWCRFNMDRVNNWFSFLKQQVQAHDHQQVPVTIKMLGFTLSTPQRDHGLDIEYLTRLQDIPGADLRVAPHDAVFYGKQEAELDPETDWRSRYAYDWVEQAMYLDFTKSLCPERLFYDSEWHGFGAVSWRHFHLKRNYVRSALWLAFTHGMGAIKPWLWGRSSDGALRDSADHIGELATQPIAVDAYGRVMKELNAHAERVVSAVPRDRRFMIYYSEEAAIQDEHYTKGFKDIYEAMKLLTLPLGFTTPSAIRGLHAAQHVLIVPRTRFIMASSLERIKTFQQAGGRVVLFDAEHCFLRTELGLARSGNGITKPFATLVQKSISQMLVDLDTALAPVRPAAPLEAQVTDLTGQRAYGVMVNQSRDATTGECLLILNNLSRHARVVSLKPREEAFGQLMDVLTQQFIGNTLTLQPCAVRMLTTTDQTRLLP
jgi:beta-galactosidase